MQGPRPLTPVERERIESLSDRTRPLAYSAYDEIAKACVGTGCHPFVEDGTRPDARQLRTWSHGRKIIGPNPSSDPKAWIIVDQKEVRTNAFPGTSAHRGPDGGATGGDAVDISLRDDKTNQWLEGGGKPDPRWYSIVEVVAKKLGMVWGGRFHDKQGRLFFDGAHLQHGEWVLPKIEPKKLGPMRPIAPTS